MTKTDIGIYRGLKEKFDPEVHVGFFITTDTGELLLGDQSLGQTISGWEINDGVLKLKLNTGRDILVTFPEATDTTKGLLSAADKAQLIALQGNLNSKVDKVTGKSLVEDTLITKLTGLPTSETLTQQLSDAKAAGTDAQTAVTAEVTRAKAAEEAIQTALDNHKADKDKKHIPAGGHERQILAWESDGTAKWDDLSNMFTGLEELLAYGVEWKDSVADPHLTRIGNMSLHKTLPIQSQLKGCIAQGEKVMYWLDQNDWRYRKDPIIMPYTCNTESSIIYSESISSLLAEGMYIKVLYPNSDSIVGLGCVTFVSNNEVYFNWETPGAKWQSGMKYDIEIGSRLDGYDGTVRVYCPSFYIKSQIIGDTRRVWLSTVKIDNTWQHQRAILIDAYRSTILHTVPENMGYLSSLPVNSAVSIVNTSDYCRGGSNRASYDQYLKGSSTVTEDICKTDLGKPITGLSRPTMRTYSRNAGSEMLSYNQYKNIFYWLYVIEYANFNCQEAYTSTLTTEGYHQGGLGNGVTTIEWQAWSQYNGSNPLTPCGYGNTIGNKTSTRKITCGTETFNVPRWRGFDNPFGDIYTILEGAVVKCENASRSSFFYTTDDVSEYSDVVGNKTIAGIECTGQGFIREFDLGTTAEIIPSSHGGDATTGKCDYHCSGLNTDSSSFYGTIRIPWVGGGANYAEAGGIGRIDVDYPVSDSWSGTGFRTISFCDNENQQNK